MLFTGNPTRPEYIESLGNSGIRIYFLECDLEWSLPGSFAKLKNKSDRILRHFPGALFIIRAMLHPPIEWIRNHPDELVRYENGETMKPGWSILRKEYEAVGTYSLASSKWRKDGGKELAAFIDMIEASGFGNHVTGYFLSAGGDVGMVLSRAGRHRRTLCRQQSGIQTELQQDSQGNIRQP